MAVNWLSHAAKSWLHMAMYIDIRTRIVNDQRVLSQVLVAAIFHPLFVPIATTVYSSIFAYESPYVTVQQAGLAGNTTSDYDH